MERRSGNTTRAVDRFVQEFFVKGITHIYEGRGTDSEKNQTQEAFRSFERRMHSEHTNALYSSSFKNIDGIPCYEVIKK